MDRPTLAFAAVAGSACTPARPLPPAGSPNVVLFTVDTLRADRLGSAGHAAAHTPHLDRLAARARVFTQATTPLTRTTPALASLLSGVDPRGHGSWEVGAPIAADVPLLAEQLQALGWETVAVSGSPVASPTQGLGRGFHHFDVEADPPAHTLVERALARVADVDAERPVFLWVHVTDPHFPYAVPASSPAHGTTPLCDALGRRFTRRPRQRWRIFSDAAGASRAALAECQVAYDVEVQQVDAAFGALLAGLGPRGDDLVVVTSDHGENQGEGGLWYEHGPDAHDASLRVPLLLAGPGVPPGEDHGVARLQDVVPTLRSTLGLPPLDRVGAGADLLGPARPPVAVGVSASALHVGLTGYLRAGRSHKRHCVHLPADGEGAWSWCSDGGFDRRADPGLEAPVALPPSVAARAEAAAEAWPPEQARQWVARTAEWVLVATPRAEGGFDLLLRPVGDDAAPDQSAARPELRHMLETALVEGSLGAPLPSPAAHATSTGGLSPEDDAALRSLGYVE